MASWLARLGEVFKRPTRAALERVSNPVQTTFVSHLVGRPNPPRDFNLHDLIHEGYRKNVVIYTCINEIATSVAAPKLCVKKKDSDEEIDNHPALDLLNRPSPEVSRYKLFETALIHLLTAGTAYIHKGRNSAHQPIQLKNLRPDRMYPYPDARGEVAAFEYRAEGQAKGQMIPREDIIRLQLPDPLNDYHGLPPIMVCAEFGDIDNEAARYLRSFFMNGAMPMGLLSLELPNVPKEIRSAIQQEWRDSFGRGDGKNLKWFDIAVLSGGAKYQAVGTEPTGLRLEAVWGMSETRICATFGVPPQIVAMRIGMQFSTYSNYEEARRSFWEETLTPMYRRLGDALTFELGVEYDDEPEIVFDLESVEALQESEDTKSERVRADYEKGIITLNEAREARGWEPIKTDYINMAPTAKKFEKVEAGEEEPPPGAPPIDPKTGKPMPQPPGQKPPPFGAKGGQQLDPEEEKKKAKEAKRERDELDRFIIEHIDWPDRVVEERHEGRWITWKGRAIFIGGKGGGGGGGGAGKGGGGFGAGKTEPDPDREPITVKFEGEKIYLARAPGLNKEQRDVETKFMKEFAADPEKMVSRYLEEKGRPVDPETGKWTGQWLISADDAKELSSDYMKDNDSRTKFAPAVHETASQIADMAYRKALRKNPEPGKNPDVVFTAGGAGSGKTSVSLALVKSVQQGHIVVDSTLSPNGGKRRIREALEARFGAVVVYTHRDPVESFENGVIPRAVKRGRFVPPEVAMAGHAKSRAGIESHYKTFGDSVDVEFRFIDNSRGKDNAIVYDSIDDLPPQKFGSYKDSAAATSAMRSRLLRQYRAGELPASILVAAGIPVPKGTDQQGDAALLLETFGEAADIERSDVEGLGKIPEGAEHLVSSRFPSLERGFFASLDVLEQGTAAEKMEQALATGEWRKAERHLAVEQFSERWTEELTRTMEDVAFAAARLHYEHHAPSANYEELAGKETAANKIRDFVKTQVQRDLRHIEKDMRRVVRGEMLRVIDKGGEIKASRILPLVGLTERQAGQVQKLRSRLEDQGMGTAKVDKAVHKFTVKLKRERAQLIAEHQTRLAESIGQRAAWERLFAEGKLKGGRRHWHKLWITANDERLCPRCEALDQWEIPLDRFFEEDEEESFFGPPIHPRCRCRIVLVETVPGWRAQEVSEEEAELETHEGRWITYKGRPIFIGGKSGGGGGGGASAPRMKDGTLADERDGTPPKKGESFVVYRVGRAGTTELKGNAGNAEGIADHIITAGDKGFETGDTINAFKVTVNEDFGDYQMTRKGKAQTSIGTDAVGRLSKDWETKDGKKRALVVYSFGPKGKFKAEKIGSVTLAEAEKILKKRNMWDHVTGGPKPWGGEAKLSMGGTESIADGIREVFKPEKQEGDAPEEGHAGKSVGQGFWFTKNGKRIFAGKGDGGGGGGGGSFMGGVIKEGDQPDVDTLVGLGELEKVGGGLGGHSNAGVFKTKDGALLYIKHTDDVSSAAGMASNEVIMAKLYETAGFQVKDHAQGTWEGKPCVLTKMMTHKGTAGPDVPGVKEGFATDAWLANWDVVGLSGDNLVAGQNGFALRMDVGGAGLFRGTGKAKGGAFGTTVEELNTLRGKPTPAGNVNEQAKWMFHGVSKQDVIDGVRNHVAKVTDAEIDAIVKTHGTGLSASQRTDLATTLKARRDFLIKKADEFEKSLAKDTPAPTPKGLEDVPAGGTLYTADNPPKLSNNVKVPQEPKPIALTKAQRDTLDRQNKLTEGKATLTNWDDPKHPRPDPLGVPTNPDSPLYMQVESYARNAMSSWKGSAQSEKAVRLKQAAARMLGVEGQAYGESKVGPDPDPHLSDMAFGMIYRDTQVRLAKAGVKSDDRIELYRGIGQEISTHSTIEGHSTSKSVASGFNSYDIEHRRLPPEALFAHNSSPFLKSAGYGNEKEWMVMTPGIPGVEAVPTHIGIKKGVGAAADAGDPTGWWSAPKNVSGEYKTGASSLDDLAAKLKIKGVVEPGEAPPKGLKATVGEGVPVGKIPPAGATSAGTAETSWALAAGAKVLYDAQIKTKTSKLKHIDSDPETKMAYGLEYKDGSRWTTPVQTDFEIKTPSGEKKKALVLQAADGLPVDHPQKKFLVVDADTLEPYAALDNYGSTYLKSTKGVELGTSGLFPTSVFGDIESTKKVLQSIEQIQAAGGLEVKVPKAPTAVKLPTGKLNDLVEAKLLDGVTVKSSSISATVKNILHDSVTGKVKALELETANSHPYIVGNITQTAANFGVGHPLSALPGSMQGQKIAVGDILDGPAYANGKKVYAIVTTGKGSSGEGVVLKGGYGIDAEGTLYKISANEWKPMGKAESYVVGTASIGPQLNKVQAHSDMSGPPVKPSAAVKAKAAAPDPGFKTYVDPSAIPTEGVGTKIKPGHSYKHPIVPASKVGDYVKSYSGKYSKAKIAQIYSLKAQGKSNKEIAEALGIPAPTVSTFLTGIAYGVKFEKGV